MSSSQTAGESIFLHPNFRRIEGTSLYRSSCLDRLDQGDIDALHDLQVKSIIDLRSPTSWDTTLQPQLIDHYYTPVVVTERGGTLKKTSLFRDDQLEAVTPKSGIARGAYGTRYFLNLIDTEFAYGVSREAPWYRQVQLLGLGVTYLFGSRTILEKIPLWCLDKPDETMILSLYKGTFKYCGRLFGRALRLLLTPENCPAVVTCTGGKDRTGMLAALLQHLSGVNHQQIIRDYAKTQDAMGVLLPEMERMRQGSGLDDTITTALPETFDQLLQFVETKYGGLSEYASHIGLSTEEIDRLKNNIRPEENI